ncbi:response regulator transcription factor [Paraburkholderia bannensis]|uniref:response regulator transcription factor n=1 Tax=Paraburkholderia bannensis TaxID=765414 RepID=UPI002ABD88A3|nr:response regulator [Paraburkholderia bannensis]
MPNPSVISIVDDDQSLRNATRSLLRSLGWEVRVYESGEEFLGANMVSDIVCIVSDVQMGGMTGLEMYEILLQRGPAPPIIFITAFPSEATFAQARKLGAICVFSKPIDATKIQQRLDELVLDGH